MMRWGIAGFVGIWLLGVGQDAGAQWEQAFRTAVDTKIYAFKKDPEDPRRFFLGIEGGILLSKDGGAAWKRVLTVPANQSVNILWHEGEGPAWWALTARSLYRSADGGQKWEARSSFGGDSLSEIRSFLASDQELYLGRRDGMTISSDGGLTWAGVAEFTGRDIYQIARSADGRVWVSSDRGVYRSAPNRSWERVYGRISGAEEDRGEESNPDETEEVVVRDPVYFWFGPGKEALTIVDGQKKYAVGTATGEVKSSGTLSQPVLNQPRVMDVRAARVAISAGREVGLWDEAAQSFEPLTAGWPGASVRGIDYDPSEDELSVVTSQGVFKFEHPELGGFLEARVQSGHERARLLIGQFDHEPGILELQEAAMRYAEVHPDKILEWRRQAARRAWLPTLSLGEDIDKNNNIDMDRGGTSDPDHFIEGPADMSSTRTIDLSWQLGDLIWSGDQTTIDNRSKLMVQLRDDLLTQLNHLYYSRRRIQIALLLEGAEDLEKEIEKRIQIDEYTAGIDALTGGYFSRQSPSARVRLEERTASS